MKFPPHSPESPGVPFFPSPPSILFSYLYEIASFALSCSLNDLPSFPDKFI